MSEIIAQSAASLLACLLFLDINLTVMLQISEQSLHAWMHPDILDALPTRQDVIHASQDSMQVLQILICLLKLIWILIFIMIIKSLQIKSNIRKIDGVFVNYMMYDHYTILPHLIKSCVVSIK